MPNSPGERPPEGLPGPSSSSPGPGRIGSSPRRPLLTALGGLVVLVLIVGIAGGGLGSLLGPARSTGLAGTPSTSEAPSESPPTGTSTTDAPTATPVPPQPSLAPDTISLLQATLDRLRAASSIPGISVAILWDDGRRWLGASGQADIASGTPLTPDSGFALASISKTFVAATVLQLVDEGRLKLTDAASTWLPAYRLDRRITIRMLLDHTSGLPDFFLNPRIGAALIAAPDAAWTPARSWSYVGTPTRVPGSSWSYSNTNYLLLGELVTAVTGRSLATEVRARFLDPLGLDHVWYQVAEPPRAPITSGYVLIAKGGGGYRIVRTAPASDIMPFRSVVTAAGGAGGLAGTALDTARWMRAFAGGRLLSAATQQAMLDDATVTRALHAQTVYGLGLQVTTVDGRRALGHTGRYSGFRGVVRYLPDDGITIAVLTNQLAVDPATITEALVAISLGQSSVSPTPSPSTSMLPGASTAPAPSASNAPAASASDSPPASPSAAP